MNSIFHRISVRKFEDRPIEKEKIVQVLKAGMQAPSACNQQPWEFYVVTDKEKIQKMKDVDIRTVNCSQLVDLNTVVIDENQSVEERLESFIEQIKNPYCFRVGDIAVKVVYKENGPTFQQNFEEMLLTM